MSNLIKRFKSYYNKDNYDYSQKFIHPYEYHRLFYKFMKLYRLIDNETSSKWTILMPIFVFCAGSSASILSIMSIYVYISDFKIPLVIECFTYLVVMIYKMLICFCTVFNKKYYHNLTKAMRADFEFICTKGIKYKERFFKNHLLTWKLSVMAAIFTGFIGSGIIVCADIALVIFLCSSNTEGRDRPFPFPFLIIGVDMTKTPAYECFFVGSHTFVISHTITYILMMLTQVVWVRQITSKADVIRWCLQDLLADVEPAKNKEEEEYYNQVTMHRMRQIVSMHHSMIELMEDYANVYSKCLMFEQKLSGPLVCLTAFCAAEKLDAGEIHGILILLCVSIIIVVLVPSWLCTFLAVKVQSVGDACWETPFWNASGPVIRPYLTLIMQRSMRQLPIAAAGFKEVSLETYSNNMTGAYSCFNMLRQANLDITT